MEKPKRKLNKIEEGFQKVKEKVSKISQSIRDSPFTQAGIRLNDNLNKGIGNMDDFYGKSIKKSKKKSKDYDFDF